MEIGVRELKQNVSEVVRRAEGGEDVTVLVAGRPSVEMIRIRSRRWRSWGEFADLFNGPADRGWDRDHAEVTGYRSVVCGVVGMQAGGS